MSTLTLPPSIAARIEVADTGCWLWTGYIDTKGYGRAHHPHRYGFPSIGAHRLVYELLVGPIPPGLHLDHTCHDATVCPGGPTCPHRRCVNPAHLFLGTAKDSPLGEIALAIEMGADAADIGHTIHPHPTLGESMS